jgi:hypothetical protein
LGHSDSADALAEHVERVPDLFEQFNMVTRGELRRNALFRPEAILEFCGGQVRRSGQH